MIYLTNIDLNQNQLMNAVLQPLATAPANPKLGQIYCDSTNSRIRWYNGTQWTVVGVVVESSATNGNIIVDGVQMSVYTLPKASPSTLGGIRVGAGLAIDSNGILSATGGGTADAVNWENVIGAPTKLSEFTNDEEFIDCTCSNLVNYYTKATTYTKDEVNTLIGNIATIQIQVVTTLPATGASNIIYLVNKNPADGDQNIYDEYLWTGSKFEKIGDTTIDLSNYLTKTGDASQATVAFTTGTRSLPATGESFSVILGKIVKYLTDLNKVAFSGAYSDLSGTPTILKSISATMSVGTLTTSVNFTGTFIGCTITDATTGEIVYADVTVNTNSISVDLAAAYNNKLNIVVVYV